jgi:hypothetical protein
VPTFREVHDRFIGRNDPNRDGSSCVTHTTNNLIIQETTSSEEADESQLPPTAAIVEHGDEEAVAEILDREAEQADSEAEQPMEDS